MEKGDDNMGNTSNLIIYSLVSVLLVISVFKDINKTKLALKKALKSFTAIMFILIPLFLFVGLMLAVVTPDTIKSVIGADSGVLGVLLATAIGGIAFMPPFVSYPLGADLLANGAGYPQIAALVTALMAIGVVYIGAETKYFGAKATFLRNILAVIGTLVVAFVVWVVL
jgi:uncharacterized membrane protein YraQ (UPF0718 family)